MLVNPIICYAFMIVISRKIGSLNSYIVLCLCLDSFAHTPEIVPTSILNFGLSNYPAFIIVHYINNWPLGGYSNKVGKIIVRCHIR